jgi:hypothetical protein
MEMGSRTSRVRVSIPRLARRDTFVGLRAVAKNRMGGSLLEFDYESTAEATV